MGPIFTVENYTKIFTNTIDSITGRHSRRKIFQDLISAYAISIANVFDKGRAETREEEYLKIIANYDKEEQQVLAELGGIIVSALNDNPNQDFLGELYMNLEISDKTRGQYFTRYNISEFMAKIVWSGTDEEEPIINEPACGSGVNLIAIANEMRQQKFNYQQKAYFVAQDIDPLVAKMCYIQLSLLGCPGVVVVGDTLLEVKGEREYWYTPFHYIFGIGILNRRKRKIAEEKAKETVVINETKQDWLLQAVGLI